MAQKDGQLTNNMGNYNDKPVKNDEFRKMSKANQADKFVSEASMLMFIAVCGALLGGFSVGMMIGYASPAVHSMESNNSRPHYDRKLDSEVETWIRSIPTIGAVAGGLTGGPLAGIAGRRVCLILVCLPLFLGWMLITIAKNTAMIITGRLFTGIIAGIFCCAVPTYVIEIAPLSLRGALGSGFQVFVVIGILVSSIIGTMVEWRTLAFLSSISAVLMPIILYFCPESPVYLFNKYGSGKETLNALKRLRSEDSQIDAELQQIAKNPKEKQPMILSWEQIKMPTVYYPLFYACGVLFFQQASGVNAVIFNELDIFILSGIKLDPNFCSIILNAVAVVATLVSAAVSDRYGRKVLLFISGLGNTLALFSLSICFYLTDKEPTFGQNYGWIALLSTISYLAFFAIGYGPIPWAIAPEMSPYFARGFITAVGTFLNWGTCFLVTKEFEKMEHLLTAAGTFAFFTIISFIGLLFTSFVLPETKGKSLEEILSIFDKKRKSEKPISTISLDQIKSSTKTVDVNPL